MGETGERNGALVGSPTKHIFVTGGVASSLGKGITASSLGRLLKARGLQVSELLQKAVRAELRRQELLAETDRYLADLVAEVGPPTAPQRTRAAAIARRIARRSKRQAD